MTHEIVTLIAQYGLLLVFLLVLLEQIGLPVPAFPGLVVAGSLVATGRLPLSGILLVGVVGCLLCDLAWYWAGRRFGARVLRGLCRLSLSPDSCVHRSELRFERWRGRMLVGAKFVPGLSLVAPALVGALGLQLRVFVLFDALGALLWTGVAVALGFVFASQIDQLLGILATAGTLTLELVGGLLVLYIAYRWWRRKRVRQALAMPRITPAQLKQQRTGGQAPLVLDVRSATSRQLDPRIIDGALPVDLEHIDAVLHDIPRDREIVTCCNCPNEATSARAAQALTARGYRNVRPLAGGLPAWEAAGLPLRQRHRAGAGGAEAPHAPVVPVPPRRTTRNR